MWDVINSLPSVGKKINNGPINKHLSPPSKSSVTTKIVHPVLFDQNRRDKRKTPQRTCRGPKRGVGARWKQDAEFEDLPLCHTHFISSFQWGCFLNSLHSLHVRSSTQPFATADSPLVHDWEVTYLQSKKRPAECKQEIVGEAVMVSATGLKHTQLPNAGSRERQSIQQKAWFYPSEKASHQIISFEVKKSEALVLTLEYHDEVKSVLG